MVGALLVLPIVLDSGHEKSLVEGAGLPDRLNGCGVVVQTITVT